MLSCAGSARTSQTFDWREIWTIGNFFFERGVFETKSLVQWNWLRTLSIELVVYESSSVYNVLNNMS